MGDLPPHEAGSTATEQLEQLSGGQLEKLLNRLERDLSRVTGRSSPVMFSPTLVFFFITLALLGEDHGPWRLEAALLIVLLASLVILQQLNANYATELRVRTRRQLDQVDVNVLLREGKSGDIAHYVPDLWRWFVTRPAVPKGYGDGLRSRLWRAAYNLDWYLQPPAQLIRPAWPLSIVSVPIGIGALVVGASYLSFSNLLIAEVVFGILWLLLVLTTLPPIRLSIAQEVWQSELLAHLRERLAEEEN